MAARSTGETKESPASQHAALLTDWDHERIDDTLSKAKEFVDTYGTTVASASSSFSSLTARIQNMFSSSSIQIQKFEPSLPPFELQTQSDEEPMVDHLIRNKESNFTELSRFIGCLGNVNTRLSFHLSALKTSKQSGAVDSNLLESAKAFDSLEMKNLETSLKKLEDFKILLRGRIQPHTTSQAKIEKLEGMLNLFEAGIEEAQHLQQQIKEKSSQVKEVLSSISRASSDSSGLLGWIWSS